MEAETLFLGAIALSTFVMAAIQVGIIIFGARVARRLNRLVDRVETDIAPALGRVDAVSENLQRVASLAVSQAERADVVVSRVVDRVDRTTAVFHDAVVEPTRHGRAVWEGIRAALSVFRRATAETERTGGPVTTEQPEETAASSETDPLPDDARSPASATR